MNFALTLRKMRLDKSLSQDDVAKHINVTRNTISAYENGKREPNFEILIKLSNYFQISTDYLLGQSSNKNYSNEEEITTFGEKLKELRKSKRITQSQLAEKIEISHQAISLYEINKRQPDFETLTKIADYFEVSVDYLLGRLIKDKNNDMELVLINLQNTLAEIENIKSEIVETIEIIKKSYKNE